MENKEFKEKFFIDCPKCKHHFESVIERTNYKNGFKGTTKCPECGKYIKLMKKLDSNKPRDLVRNEDGNYIRRRPKGLSKKQRRKIRKEENNE